ncbi:MAG: hypothetical protein AB7Q42_08175 [Acidimicrobiia bacterium]
MAGAENEPRAVVVLVQGGREVVIGTVSDAIRCDLALVDDLLRLQLISRRLGWTIRFIEVRSDLRELFDMVGLTERLDP